MTCEVSMESKSKSSPPPWMLPGELSFWEWRDMHPIQLVVFAGTVSVLPFPPRPSAYLTGTGDGSTRDLEDAKHACSTSFKRTNTQVLKVGRKHHSGTMSSFAQRLPSQDNVGCHIWHTKVCRYCHGVRVSTGTGTMSQILCTIASRLLK